MVNIKNIHALQKKNDPEVLEKFENFEAEIAVIGCLLWDNKSYEKVVDFLNEDHFTDVNNKKIYSTIKNLLDKNILVTPITLKNYLEDNNNKFDNYTYLNHK